MRSLTWDEVRSRRLARSHLVERAPAERLVEVVRDICGLHAQVMGSAELQLAARVDGITQTDVRDALWKRRSLAKTWTIRGTLHIHPADELRLWTAAREALVGAGPESDRLEQVEEVVAAIAPSRAGRCCARSSRTRSLSRLAPGHATGWRRAGATTWANAAAAGLLLFGAPRGAKVTFVHPADWLCSQRAWEPREALREVASRYANAYGPVTYRQFREWSGSRSYDDETVRALFEELAPPEVEPLPPARPSVRLLSEYDPFVMGFREREHLVPEPVRAQVAAHRKGRYEGPAGTPFLLVDGLCAGIWSRRKTTRKIELVVEPARKLTRGERAGVSAEAERIGAFLSLEPQVTIS